MSKSDLASPLDSKKVWTDAGYPATICIAIFHLAVCTMTALEASRLCVCLLHLSILTLLPVPVSTHGAMVFPRPRSSHGQILDDQNKCSCQHSAEGCYSQAGWPASSYCGLGCIGESCLYYHIGCYQVQSVIIRTRASHRPLVASRDAAHVPTATRARLAIFTQPREASRLLNPDKDAIPDPVPT